MPVVKGASDFSPLSPVIAPMTRLPMSTKTEPLKKASRHNSPHAKLASRSRPKRRASTTPMTMAGDSMSAIAATIQPLKVTPRCVSSDVAAMKVTALTEP